jgi:hypothetical protein
VPPEVPALAPVAPALVSYASVFGDISSPV